jgi:hypothetical protein
MIKNIILDSTHAQIKIIFSWKKSIQIGLNGYLLNMILFSPLKAIVPLPCPKIKFSHWVPFTFWLDFIFLYVMTCMKLNDRANFLFCLFEMSID